MTNDVEFQIGRSIIYSNIFSLLERIGDHILNVTEGITESTKAFKLLVQHRHPKPLSIYNRSD